MTHLVSPTEALTHITDGSTIWVGQLSGTPTGLLCQLADARHNFTDLHLVTGYLFELIAPLHHLGNPFRFTTLQPSRTIGDVLDHPAVSVVPCRYSDFAPLTAPDQVLACDAAIISVSPPRDGMVSLGTSAGATRDILDHVPVVIAQVNPQVPRTLGAALVPVEGFAALTRIDEEIPSLINPDPDDTVLAVAANAAAMIPDGATLQFGIGALPEAILSALTTRRNLSIHGGMVSPACRTLVDAGAVTGPLRVAEVVGDEVLRAWTADNPLVEMIGASRSHGIRGLAPVENLVAINSTIEMALDGSINSEMVNGTRISGPGGAPDYMSAASMATNGRSMIAFPSTAARGKVSRIVRTIAPPSPITAPGLLADIVVTEFGVAELRGRSLEERASALRAIAHPDFRDALG